MKSISKISISIITTVILIGTYLLLVKNNDTKVPTKEITKIYIEKNKPKNQPDPDISENLINLADMSLESPITLDDKNHPEPISESDLNSEITAWENHLKNIIAKQNIPPNEAAKLFIKDVDKSVADIFLSDAKNLNSKENKKELLKIKQELENQAIDIVHNVLTKQNIKNLDLLALTSMSELEIAYNAFTKYPVKMDLEKRIELSTLDEKMSMEIVGGKLAELLENPNNNGQLANAPNPEDIEKHFEEIFTKYEQKKAEILKK